MDEYGRPSLGSDNKGISNIDKITIIVTVLIIIAIGLYFILPQIKENNARNNTFSIEDYIGPTPTVDPNKPGNPFDDGRLHIGNYTYGYFNVTAQTDPANGKFYFKVDSLDTEKKPQKQDLIIDVAISNDGGISKTLLCTDKHIDKNELNSEASITLTFSLNIVSIQSGTIIYYSIKRDAYNAIPAVGELTL